MVTQFPSYSRTFLQDIINNNLIVINGMIVNKSSTQLKENDIIHITFSTVNPEAKQTGGKENYTYNVSVIEKQDHFLIINKPFGLMVHAAEGTDMNRPC